MKKILMAAALLVAGASIANAEGYNRVALSYDMQHFSMNKEYTGADKSAGRNLNGFGVAYTHGFGVAENMFVETGLGFNAGFGTESEGDYKQKMQNMNFKVPVNYVYRFNVADGITIAPYAGINFKLNVATKLRDEYDGQKSDWVSVFDKDKMGSDDLTWNRFQMGWHVGVGFSYDKYYLGIQYGTDFIPAYSHKFDGVTPKVNSSNLNIAVGYTF